MAHFAKLDLDSKVIRVEVVSNDIATTEQAGVDFLNTLHGTSDVWKQTSYNTRRGVHSEGGTPFRKNFAGIGYTYDSGRNAFIPPRPLDQTEERVVCNSWILDEDTCQWEPPIPYPDDTKDYVWDENTHQEDNSLGWMLI